jgi:hypothetical protein
MDTATVLHLNIKLSVVLDGHTVFLYELALRAYKFLKRTLPKEFLDLDTLLRVFPYLTPNKLYQFYMFI